METDRLTTSARYPESFLTRGQCLQSSNLGFRRPERALKIRWFFVSLRKSRPKPLSRDVIAVAVVTISARDEQLLIFLERVSELRMMGSSYQTSMWGAEP
jgi:hypothetical protein